MRGAVAAAFGLFLVGVLFGLAQLWLRIWTPETFFKLAVTDAALIVVALAWIFIVRERRESERIRKHDRLG